MDDKVHGEWLENGRPGEGRTECDVGCGTNSPFQRPWGLTSYFTGRNCGQWSRSTAKSKTATLLADQGAYTYAYHEALCGLYIQYSIFDERRAYVQILFQAPWSHGARGLGNQIARSRSMMNLLNLSEIFNRSVIN